jgi:hypothetical protein
MPAATASVGSPLRASAGVFRGEFYKRGKCLSPKAAIRVAIRPFVRELSRLCSPTLPFLR